MYKNLLTFQNAKTSKGEDLGYLTGILYMAPANLVEGINVCPFATEGCKSACLYSAGRGKFSNVQTARINKTVLWRDDRQFFLYSLVQSINALIRKAKRNNLTPVVRLNGTSDITWESITYLGKTIFDHFPDIQFYDYTKNPYRFDKPLPRNYHLTFSKTEYNDFIALDLLERGVNVAVVFDKLMHDKINTTKLFLNFKVIDGDEHDLRFLDGTTIYGGQVIALKAKGDAKCDQSGFVIAA